jgi:hypothetical protein
VSNDKRRVTGGTAGTSKTPERRAWEPMSLTKVGTFGDVLRGNTGSKGDGGTRRM